MIVVVVFLWMFAREVLGLKFSSEEELLIKENFMRDF